MNDLMVQFKDIKDSPRVDYTLMQIHSGTE